MPDRDVFNRHVQREWRTIARLLLGAEVDPSIPQRAVRHLAEDFKRNGCPGFDQIVEIVVEAVDSHQPMEIARLIAVDRLEQTRRREGSSRTEVTVSAANVVLAELAHHFDAVVGDRSELQLTLATRILAEVATKRMYPSSLFQEMVEHELLSFQTMTSIEQRCKRLLQSAPETKTLAAQLLQDPAGCAVKLPRRRKPNRSQAELLVSAIS